MESEVVLLLMHLADFRAGYQAGRRLRFQGASPTNDTMLMGTLYDLAARGGFSETERADTTYLVGQLIGSISCNVIPRQAEESDSKEREQRFLKQVRQQFAGHPHVETVLNLVQSFWGAQDELARLLTDDLYESLLRRGTITPIILQ